MTDEAKPVEASPPQKASPEESPTALIPHKPQELSKPGGGKDSYGMVATKPFEKDVQAILNRDFKWDEAEITPDGVVYAPGVRYRTRLDEAFGQGRHGMVRKTEWSDPRTHSNVIMATFHLIVDGRYINESTGGMTYHPKNARMTYDDAIEGATTNAMMRCCKKLGVGAKLWDPNYTRQWKKDHALRVWCVSQQDGKSKQIWRRADDPDAINWPWKERGNAPEMKQPQRKGEKATPSKGTQAPPKESQDQPPPPPEAGLFEKSIVCSVIGDSPKKKMGTHEIWQFKVKVKATGAEHWVTTNKPEVADVMRSCFETPTDADLSVKEHAAGALELLSASPIL